MPLILEVGGNGEAIVALWSAAPLDPRRSGLASKSPQPLWIAVRLHDSRLLSDRTLVDRCRLLACRRAGALRTAHVAHSICRRPCRATFPHSSRSWPSPWRDCRRRRWPWRGIGIGAGWKPPRDSTASSGRRRIVVGAVLLLIGLPVVLTLSGAVSYHVRNRSNGSIISSGQEREYLLHVPETYDSKRPTPLVISMHGGAAWPAAQMHLSRWNRLADENGFIVVYPAGTGSMRSWQTFDPDARLERDVRFISELIDTIQAAYNVDPTQIYANGMSNGGGMAFVLSCTLSDRLAAVGLVAPAQSLPVDWCSNTRPVPMVAFQGTADRFVRYEGGPMADPINPDPPVFPATRDWVGRWAARNRCGASSVESEMAVEVTRLEYTRLCRGCGRPALHNSGRRSHVAGW